MNILLSILKALFGSLSRSNTKVATTPADSVNEAINHLKIDVPELDMYYRWKKGDMKHLTPHVLTTEVDCRRCDLGSEQIISKELLKSFEQLRMKYGSPIRITSGYRCLVHNRVIGSSDTSQHVLGNALDLQPLSFTNSNQFEKLYIDSEKYFKSIGDARNRSSNILSNFIHVDTRSDKIRRWKY